MKGTAHHKLRFHTESQPCKEDAATQQIALEAAKQSGLVHTRKGIEDLTGVILSAIERSEQTAERATEGRPRIKNLKMLDAIHAVIIEHSGNVELAGKVWEHLVSKGFKHVTAPPQPHPSKARKEQAPRAEGSPASGPVQCTHPPEDVCPMCPPQRSEQDNRDYIAKNLYKINPETDFDENGNLIRPQPRKGELRGQHQEWTPEQVQATLKDRPFASSTIASHHNAELAVEREKHKTAYLSFRQRLNSFEQQLAAERDTRIRLQRIVAEQVQELATERQRREQAAEEMRAMNDRWAQIHTLLGTQGQDDWDKAPFAKIRELQNHHVDDSFCCIDIEPSALHQHDAEVRDKERKYWQNIAVAHDCRDLTDAFVQLTKAREAREPLVKALEDIRAWNNNTLELRYSLNDYIDNALAKVKEGK